MDLEFGLKYFLHIFEAVEKKVRDIVAVCVLLPGISPENELVLMDFG